MDRPAWDDQFRESEGERNERLRERRARATALKDKAVKDAEWRIQRILVELEELTGKSVEEVDVDTRNFAQLRTGITLRDGQRV